MLSSISRVEQFVAAQDVVKTMAKMQQARAKRADEELQKLRAPFLEVKLWNATGLPFTFSNPCCATPDMVPSAWQLWRNESLYSRLVVGDLLILGESKFAARLFCIPLCWESLSFRTLPRLLQM